MARVQVFDCVEFSKAIRCADVASDLAFLMIDLERLGVGSVAADLLALYRKAGLSMPEQLVRFYSAHRALVKGKVVCQSGHSSNRRSVSIWLTKLRCT